MLITGAARVEGSQGDPADPLRYFNSIQVVGKDGSVGATYDKVHLVPFGEYVPYESLLGRLGISQFVPLPGGFTPGGRPHLLHVPGLPPIVPVVCYEASFTGEILPPGDEDLGAGAILNVSDDGWFGQTAGPYQHLAQARLRAIEQGLPLLRAANTGISAIIDPYGRILQELPLGRAAVIDGFLPKSVAPTIFAEYNQTIQWVTLGLLLTGHFPDALRGRTAPVRIAGMHPRSIDFEEDPESHRQACRKPGPHAPCPDRDEPGKTRRGARSDVPAGAEIREGHETGSARAACSRSPAC